MQFDLENPFESQFEKKTLSIFQEKYENPFEDNLFSPVDFQQQQQQKGQPSPLQASQLCYKKQFGQDCVSNNTQTCFNFNFDNIDSFDNNQVPNYMDVGEKSQLNQFEDDHLDQIFEQQSMQSEIAIDLNNNNSNIPHIVTQQQTILAEQQQQNNNDFDIQEEDEDSNSQLNPAKSQDFENPEKAFSMEFMPFDSNTEQENNNNNFKVEEEEETKEQSFNYQQQDQLLLSDNDETNNKQEEQQQEQFEFEHADKFQATKIWKVTTSIQKKKKQRDYDKNIVRYLARQIIRCCVDKYQYQEKVKQFCQEYLEDNKDCEELSDFDTEKMYQSTVSFLLGKIEFITGHRAFQNLLCFDEDPEAYHQKSVFKNFACWFLKERALRYIISGSMTDKKSYLKFKNSILLYYVRRPEKWNSNTKFTQKRK